MNESNVRMMPQALDAERAVLGAVLVSPEEVMGLCSEMALVPEHFYVPGNQTMFALMRELYEGRKPFDMVLMTQLLRDAGRLDEVGGPAGVAELFAFMPTAANALHHIKIVQKKARLREIIVTCSKFASRAYDESEDDHDLMDELQGEMLRITEQGTGGDTIRHVLDGVHESIEQIEHTYNHRGQVTGLETGFVQLDRMTNGLRGQNMVVIAARPSMGKTALGVNICEHVAIHKKVPVMIFSLEMGYKELVMRMVCSQADLNLQRVRDGFMAARKFDGLMTAAERLGSAPIFVDDTPALAILDFKARARIAVRRHGCKLIMVDYLQLMRSTSKRARENRVMELTEVSAGIKATAKELDVPIIVLAQLNRDVEKRRGSVPQISDLRECGAIEQDGDLIGLLYRPDYYRDKTKGQPEEDEEDGGAEDEGRAQLIIGKQRNGPVGVVELKFVKEYARFENPDGQKLYSNNEAERQGA